MKPPSGNTAARPCRTFVLKPLNCQKTQQKRQEMHGTAFAIERSEQNLSQFDDITF
jgi:hypothetical protein